MTMWLSVLALVWSAFSGVAALLAWRCVLICGFCWIGKIAWGDVKPVRTTVYSVLFCVLFVLNTVQGFRLGLVLLERFEAEQQLEAAE